MAILAMFFLLFPTLHAQSEYGFHYPDTLPMEYWPDHESRSKVILDNVPASYMQEEPLLVHRYADNSAFAIASYIAGGAIYPGWYEFENYLNEVLQQVMPEELKEHTNIHIFLVKDGNLNAGMSATGDMFINVGLMANIENEAALAGILAHELAHYYLQHSVKGHYKFNRKNKYGDWGLLGRQQKLEYKFSRFQEQQSDSLSLEWMFRSNFDLKGSVDAFRMMKRDEAQLIRHSLLSGKLTARSHPLTDERLADINKFILQHPAQSGKKFVVNESLFKKFQSQSKIETVKAFLDDFSYLSCIEMAFRFHLFEPDNPVFVYYIMEGIRKMTYLDHNRWKYKFITSRYYEPIDPKDVATTTTFSKKRVEQHLFEKFDLEIMGLGPSQLRNIQARFYWEGEPRFVTYAEAFEFYALVAKKIGCSECYLTNALSIDNDKTQRKQLLKKYLSQEGILHREYAMQLLENSIYENLPEKKLLLFEEFRATIYQGTEQFPINVQSRSQNKLLDSLMNNVVEKFPDRKPISLLSLRYNNLPDFMLLRQMYRMATEEIPVVGKRLTLHDFDPRYWKMLNKYGVNEIEYLISVYDELRKPDNSLENYKAMKELDYDSFFLSSGTKRTFATYIAAVKDCPVGRTNVRYTTGTNNIRSKEPGFDQMASTIRAAIYGKERRLKSGASTNDGASFWEIR